MAMKQFPLLPLNKNHYRFAFLKSSIAVFKWKLFRIKPQTHTFLHHKDLSLAQGNEVLTKMLSQSEPFAAVRIGAVEMGALHNYEQILLGIKKTFKPIVRYSMKHHAGFFPTDDKHLTFYAKHFMKDAKKTDVFGISGIHMEAYMFQRYFGTKHVIPYEAFEPLRGDWIHKLAGKKVLVVSPFAEDIEKQYANRKNLFPEGILPEFKLITVKAAQTIAEANDPRYANWFDALDAMKVAIMKHDFDVALIGAVAYGAHLCWFVKMMGKQAIQIDDETQMIRSTIDPN